MLHSEHKPSLRRALQHIFVFFDRHHRHRRRVEQDLLGLSPYLQQDMGFPFERIGR